MTVLVTGASGFLGAALCQALAGDGRRVIGVDRQPTAAIIDSPKGCFAFEAADVTRMGSLDRVLETTGVRQLVVCAAVTADAARERSDPAGVTAVNVCAVADAIASAARHGVKRVLYIGSGAVYGDSAAGSARLTEEDTPLRPHSLYAISKQAGEAVALRLAESLDVDVVAARLGTCFGPFERPTGSRDTLSAPYQVLRLAAAGIEARLPRPGRRDWLYVRDAVAGLVALLDTSCLSHRVYNVAAGFEWSIADWCGRVVDLYPGFRWSIADDANVDLYDAFDRAPMDIERLMADTAYRPRYDLAAAAADFLRGRSTNTRAFHDLGTPDRREPAA